MIELRVAQEDSRLRIDRFLALKLPLYSRSRLQELIRRGDASLNMKTVRPSELLRTGDVVRLLEPPVEPSTAQAEAIPLNVLFEDNDLLVLNKAAGIVVHPGSGNREHTIVNALLHHCTNLSGIGGQQRPGIVHRLDKDTSGCLVVAKNDFTHQHLAKQFADRLVIKTYLALVAGNVKKKGGSIDAPIGRHPVQRKKMSVAPGRGRTALTTYRVLATGPSASLVECLLHSGRTHQIRVHLHHLGHAVLGDRLYGPKQTAPYPRQMLHAWKLGFQHPRTGQKQDLVAPLPEDFETALRMTLGAVAAELLS